MGINWDRILRPQALTNSVLWREPPPEWRTYHTPDFITGRFDDRMTFETNIATNSYNCKLIFVDEMSMGRQYVVWPRKVDGCNSKIGPKCCLTCLEKRGKRHFGNNRRRVDGETSKRGGASAAPVTMMPAASSWTHTKPSSHAARKAISCIARTMH